jgi:hypothetical protein
MIALTAMGLPLIDNCDLEELSLICEKQQKWDFFVTINPLRLDGATGSPVNPIAIL